jgi:hypothetical protein
MNWLKGVFDDATSSNEIIADLVPAFETLKVATGMGPYSALVSDTVCSTISTFETPGARAGLTNAAKPAALKRQATIAMARLRVSFMPTNGVDRSVYLAIWQNHINSRPL